MATSMLHSKPESSGTYTYSSQPRAVAQGKKYREQDAYGNIMYDRRIVRGNTYALHTLPASSQPDPLELQRQQESRRRAFARKRARDHLRPQSPEAVEGRRHADVQTELYLEEITDRVEEADIATQTDAFLDRPPTPLFVPAKTGVDVATQIEDGDLFDFDLEVRPILEVLVGKTVEQALLEVMEEEELGSLRAQQRQFEENRNAELVETQRLEEQERRRREEKEHRMQQQRQALIKEKETAEKIAARAFSQSYLSDLVSSVFSTLNESGFFYDPVERVVESEFMPWLLDEAEKSLNKKILARTLLDAIIRDVVMKRLGITPPEPEIPPSEPQPTPQEVSVKPPETVGESSQEQTTAAGTEQAGTEEGKPIEGAGTEEGKPIEGAGTEEGKPIEGAGTEEGKPIEGAGTEEGKPIEGAGTEEGKPIEGAGTEEGKPTEGAGIEEGKPKEEAGTEEGKPIEGAGTEEGKPTEGAGTEEGKPKEEAGTEEGKPTEGAGTEEGKPKEEAGTEEGKPTEEAGTEEGKPTEGAGTEEGKPTEGAGTEEGKPGTEDIKPAEASEAEAETVPQPQTEETEPDGEQPETSGDGAGEET